MSKFAWVTLTTNDTYSLGALVLAHSLKRAGTVHQLAVLVTPGVSETMRNKLKDVYNLVQDVNVLDSQDAANLALLARPELGITFTKLHCWRLMQFEKCVFLDSDTLVLQNCDELFEREELSAAPDVSWPDCFNSGVFVFKPSLETFAKIIEFAAQHGSFDGGDQGLLNSYFSDWAHTDINKHLPFVYNVAAYASYCYLPAFKQFRDKIKILHFAGKMKPWLIQFDSKSKTACTPSDYAHAAEFIQFWWNIFCDNVHHNLTDTMIYYWPTVVQWVYFHHNHNYYDNSNQDHYESEQNEQQQQQQQQEQYQYNFIDEIKEYHDPWEDYYKNLEKQSDYNEHTFEHEHHTTYDKNETNYEQHREPYHHGPHHHEPLHHEPHHPEPHHHEPHHHEPHHHEPHHHEPHHHEPHHHEPHHHEPHHHEPHHHHHHSAEDENNYEHYDNVRDEKTHCYNDECCIVNIDEQNNNNNNDKIRETQAEEAEKKVAEEDEEEEESQHTQHEIHESSTNYEEIHRIAINSAQCSGTDSGDNDVNDGGDMITTTAPTTTTSTTLTTQQPDEIINVHRIEHSVHSTDDNVSENENDFEKTNEEAGLAGALAQLRLGEQRTPEQEAYEQLMRRQCWESGQIDYSGKDSFENIWKKITQTLEEKPAPSASQQRSTSEPTGSSS